MTAAVFRQRDRDSSPSPRENAEPSRWKKPRVYADMSCCRPLKFSRKFCPPGKIRKTDDIAYFTMSSHSSNLDTLIEALPRFFTAINGCAKTASHQPACHRLHVLLHPPRVRRVVSDHKCDRRSCVSHRYHLQYDYLPTVERECTSTIVAVTCELFAGARGQKAISPNLVDPS